MTACTLQGQVSAHEQVDVLGLMEEHGTEICYLLTAFRVIQVIRKRPGRQQSYRKKEWQKISRHL